MEKFESLADYLVGFHKSGDDLKQVDANNKQVEASKPQVGFTYLLNSNTCLDDLASKQQVSEASKSTCLTPKQVRASKGGVARAASLTAARRQEIARHAIRVRWAKQNNRIGFRPDDGYDGVQD